MVFVAHGLGLLLGGDSAIRYVIGFRGKGHDDAVHGIRDLEGGTGILHRVQDTEAVRSLAPDAFL